MSAARRYRCTTCNHVYDPAEGDPEAGIAPGTPFESLPDDWSCPECGASKADFEMMGSEVIEALRREVDAIDDDLVMLLARRRDVVARLGAEKRSVGLPGTDAAREAALRVRWAERARETGLPEAIALAVLDAVLAHSRAHVATVIDEG